MGTTHKYFSGDDFINPVFLLIFYCEAQARVRQGRARDGPQGERPQSLNPCLELTLKLVGTDHFEDLNLIDGNFR